MTSFYQYRVINYRNENTVFEILLCEFDISLFEELMNEDLCKVNLVPTLIFFLSLPYLFLAERKGN